MGDIYCLVCASDKIESYLCSGDCSSCDHYETGKCFKIAAEDADAVERVKDLLRHLREPVTGCNRLPKLTAKVFDRPDCPKWANYAAVDRDGIGRVFECEPMAEEDGWYSFGSEELVGGGVTRDHYKSTIVKGDWNTESDAIAATVAKLKEVER